MLAQPLTENPERVHDISQGSSPTPGGRPPLVTVTNIIPSPAGAGDAKFHNPQSSPKTGVAPMQTAGSASTLIDSLQAAVERMPQVELPLTHRFTPGMYVRTIFMPKGALVISKIHRTQHPFVVTKGRCLVWAPRQSAPGEDTRPATEVQEIAAGHIGITLPGTRRIIYICEDTEWTTFHATNKTTPEEVEADIIEPHDFDREEALAQMGRMNGFLDGWINEQGSLSPPPSKVKSSPEEEEDAGESGHRSSAKGPIHFPLIQQSTNPKIQFS